MHADDLEYPVAPSDSERSRHDAPRPGFSPASSPALGALSSASSSNLSSLVASVAARKSTYSEAESELFDSDASFINHLSSAPSLPDDLYDSSDAPPSAPAQPDLGISSAGELRGLDVTVTRSQANYLHWINKVRGTQ
jgi:hypothetical protein